MAQFSVSGRSTSAGTATLPAFSLYGGAAGGGKIREIGVFNTTGTAFTVSLQRFTATGTQGAALTEIGWEPDTGASLCQGFNTHTVTPTITAGVFRTATIGAAAGAGVIWTFGGTGLIIKLGTANGYGILCPVGTGQVVDFYIDWEE
jgi:hypothetical protein